MMSLHTFNTLSRAEAYDQLLRVCGSRNWAETMEKRRPFSREEDFFEAAKLEWWGLAVSDWMEAFSAHPKIGDSHALKEKFSKSSWEGDEQSGANSASEETLSSLAQLNNDYDRKNGFIFLICATGKSAAEMLAALQARMENDRATEVQVAAGEQAKIIQLRLVKLLHSLVPPSSKL